MRFIRIAGLCLVALAAVAMATAATASAQPVWQVNGTPVAGTEKVMASGTLRLTDTSVPILGRSEVECSGTTTGTIGPGKFDRVETIHIASCRQLAVCKNVETVKPVNLPWQTELTEKGGQIRDTIREVSGEPGWAVTCNTSLGSKTDTCETEAGKEGSTTATNEAVHGYVLGEFGPTSKAKCSIGGKESGEVGGIITTLSEPIGKVISVS
jgi:hypothetical protein